MRRHLKRTLGRFLLALSHLHDRIQPRGTQPMTVDRAERGGGAHPANPSPAGPR